MFLVSSHQVEFFHLILISDDESGWNAQTHVFVDLAAASLLEPLSDTMDNKFTNADVK